MSEPYLSIVVPAYNEAQRLPRTLERVRDWVERKRRVAGLEIEVLVVDDGSKDDTAQVVTAWQSEFDGLRLVSNGRNRGKGYSVHHGMLEALGRISLFTDADLSAPIEEADKLLIALEEADVAIGSRALDRRLIETHQSVAREMAGRIFNGMVRLLTGVRFLDTQCGFKAFTDEAAEKIFNLSTIGGWGFDVEILTLARRLGYKIKEIPVHWVNDTRSHVKASAYLKVFGDTCIIRWKLWRNEYRLPPKETATT